MKKITCFTTAFLLIGMLLDISTLSSKTFYAENEVSGPFSFTVTDIDSDGYFTVNVNVSEDCLIEAFKIIITYNSGNITVKEGSYGIRYYSSFTDKYNANAKGLCAKNHLSDNKQIIFAGAQPQKSCAKLNKDDRVAYVTFKYSGSSDAKYEDIVSSVSANIVNCSDGEHDIVKENPDLFIEAVTPQPGDELRGEMCMPGDVDDSGKVDLKDAKIVLAVSLGITTVDADKMEAADVDFDGKVTLKDAKLVLKYSLGIINAFV